MASKKKFEPADLSAVTTHSITDCRRKVSLQQFASLPGPDTAAGEFLASLPDVLAAASLRKLIQAIVAARKNERPVVAALGGHVVKCGLGPVLIDLMKQGFITAVAMHGATAIHDFEISLIGQTSEDVPSVLKDGSFGMARETPQAFARAAELAGHGKSGLGSNIGKDILERKNPYARYSVLAAAADLDLPAAVLLALGTDIICMHPDFSAEKLAAASHLDFRILVSIVADLEGGVWMNIGSAVVLPEVFLKALSVARNLGSPIQNFTTANLDMQQHYRPNTNVVGRPTETGYSITGHHEIMLPLLRMGILWLAGGKEL
ncbi:MAG: hypothetical protein C4520_15530 [Candidatus Abyssobacteria bacterium SURF_5]|uniref:Deoxyhypusine synthase n=1 Tax=Abyssobacteria bacterium (strain SURF_5) TaxID=2093360 RepID=A0A3A4NGV4_ABYX5|nr:MAG: hypothetical protein C4520_15530 [Candidatus Abyssubacteria bacterium SURF_5]